MRRPRLWCLGLAGCLTVGWVQAQTNSIVLFSTGFEAAEGYNLAYTLRDQNLWTGEGSGGNGLVTNYFAGQGQQAFIGYFAPTGQDTFLSLWRPINYTPPAQPPVRVQFSVQMSIIDSTTGFYDDFRWSVYNQLGQRLFSLNFNNADLHLYYSLNDTNGFIATGQSFAVNDLYDLTLTMDFGRNQWSATLEQTPLVTNLPIATTSAELTLGDVDAVWVLGDPAMAGDNYMVFDNYRVLVTELPPPAPPSLKPGSYLPTAGFVLQAIAQPSQTLVLEFSNNLKLWTPLRTNTVDASGRLDLWDATAAGQPLRFYRTRLLSP